MPPQFPSSATDGHEAREQSATVAVQFDKVRHAVNAYCETNDTLEPDVVRGIFDAELRHCLAKLVPQFHNPTYG